MSNRYRDSMDRLHFTQEQKLEMANQESLVEIFRQSWQVLPVANQIQLDGIF